MQLRPHQLKAVQAMFRHTKGQIIVPTGGGKTMCMINDAEQRFRSTIARTIVVVAPRILLANQLSSEFLEFILMLMLLMFIVERLITSVQLKLMNLKTGIIIVSRIS